MSTALEEPSSLDRTNPPPACPTTSAPVAPGKLTERLLSLDAYRGLIMALLICNGLGFATFKNDPNWGWLAAQVDHVKWEGCVFWDLIQPGFMFMVGVAMPFAFAKRQAAGDSWGLLFRHACLRALNLCLVGLFLDCVTGNAFTIGFMRVLQQIAVGYVLAFLLLGRSYWTQGIAAALILLGYTAAWMLFPGNDPAGAWVMGNKNLGSTFDLWMVGRNYSGFYVGLNAIPATATILFGVMCGRLVGSELPKPRVMQFLAIAAVVGFVLGWLLSAGATPLVPMVKRIWTASFTFWAAGWTILFLLAFYWLIEVQGWRRWPTFLVVVGMNSIFAYSMAQLFRASFFDRGIAVFTKPLAALLFDHPHLADAIAKPANYTWPEPLGLWGNVLQAALVLAAEWGVLYWLYRRKIFFKL
jgi:predicted acyltransferase